MLKMKNKLALFSIFRLGKRKNSVFYRELRVDSRLIENFPTTKKLITPLFIHRIFRKW